MLLSAYEAFPSRATFRETSKPICLVPRFESQSDSRKNDAVFRKIRIIKELGTSRLGGQAIIASTRRFVNLVETRRAASLLNYM